MGHWGASPGSGEHLVLPTTKMGSELSLLVPAPGFTCTFQGASCLLGYLGRPWRAQAMSASLSVGTPVC